MSGSKNRKRLEINYMQSKRKFSSSIFFHLDFPFLLDFLVFFLFFFLFPQKTNNIKKNLSGFGVVEKSLFLSFLKYKNMRRIKQIYLIVFGFGLLMIWLWMRLNASLNNQTERRKKKKNKTERSPHHTKIEMFLRLHICFCFATIKKWE